MTMSIRISIAALLVITVEAFVASPFCRLESEISGRSSRLARRVPYYDDYNGDDESNYNTRDFENQSFRTIGDSPVERELRSIPYEVEDEDVNPISSLEFPRKRPQIQQYDNQESDDEYYRESDIEDDEPDVGNFWSNPNGRADTSSPRERRRSRPGGTTRPRRRPLDGGTSRSYRRKSRSTFRSGTPEPPVAISDFYNRLFWYGVDPEETTPPADRTMFGGTKGKFNGLSYINQVKDDKYSRQESEYWDDEGYDNSDMVEQEGKLAPRRESVTPPYDPPAPRTRNGEQEPGEQRRRRPQRPSAVRTRDDYNYDESGDSFSDDWASQRVSKWFEGEDDDDFFPRRKTRRKDASWSGFDFLDSFLGLDRRKLEKQATQYDERMGIGKKRHRRPRPNDQLQRNEYSYRVFNEDDESLQLDTEDDDVIDTQAVSSDTESKEEQEVEPRELTWEERAAAIERVPPADVPAWGVTGDLGVDARTKAITDALEDIADARRNVQEKERNERLLREEMTVLRVDAELEKKRLRRSQMTTKAIQEKLRRIDRQIEDAARGLRYSQMKLKEARDGLSDVETRHWAVLSFYNPGLAEKGVEEALRELEETEPAVRRYIAKASLDVSARVDSPISQPEAPVETAQENKTTD